MGDNLMRTLDSDAPLPPLSAIPDDLQSLADYERAAPAHMQASVWQHIQSGEGAETSLAANRAQYDRWRLLPRRLQSMQGASTALELLGEYHAAPLMLAPVAYHRLVHPQGEAATISAATALDVGMIASTLASVSLEDMAAQAQAAATELGRTVPPPLWFQLYLQPEREHSLQLLRRAEKAGFSAIVVTVDAAIKRSDFTLPEGVEAVNLRGLPRITQQAHAAGGQILFGTPLIDAVPTWEDMDWLRQQTRLPILVKGLLSADDAARAADLGMDGVIVSNHGGRVLDGLVTPLEALPAMHRAVGGRLPLLLDGGIRCGTDILKALALGASMVLIGRPQLHALAVAGVQGVAHVLHLLRAELELAMAQTGCATLADIGPELLVLVPST